MDPAALIGFSVPASVYIVVPIGQGVIFIIHVHVPLLNIAATHGSPLEHWQQIGSVMIEKKAGNYQLNKLRTIHMFKAEYNWLLGMILGGHYGVHGTETQNHLHEG